MDYKKNNSNTGLIIVADCMLLSVEYIGNAHLFFNSDFNGHIRDFGHGPLGTCTCYSLYRKYYQ